ncbi:hypothetical protein F5X98DRAFT_302325 [Xylaria grammica]|nr:hypothetical protein F5X98DRAFT_302325 [Xylaria grammica]
MFMIRYVILHKTPVSARLRGPVFIFIFIFGFPASSGSVTWVFLHYIAWKWRHFDFTPCIFTFMREYGFSRSWQIVYRPPEGLSVFLPTHETRRPLSI